MNKSRVMGLGGDRERAPDKTSNRPQSPGSGLTLQGHKGDLEGDAKELQAALGALQSVMDSVPDIILTTSIDGTILGANDSITRILGLAPSDVIGKRLTQLIPRHHHETLENDPTHTIYGEEVDIRKGDDVITFELTGTCTRIADELRCTIILRDISRRKAAERTQLDLQEKLNDARRLESIGTLASGVAHEINTPIQFIGDNLSFMREALVQIKKSYELYEQLAAHAEKDGAYIDSIKSIRAWNDEIDINFIGRELPQAITQSQEGIDQVRNIVKAMRDFAHPGSNERTDTDINQVVKSALTVSYNSYKHIAIASTDLDPAEPVIKCVSGQVQQVVLNILVNAVHAIEDTGRTDGCIKVATRLTKDNVQVRISDNGTGIPESIRRRIFDPFFTTKDIGRGTGQGLSLAREIVVQTHGGRLYLDDEPGMATTFVIELPLKEPLAASTAILSN